MPQFGQFCLILAMGASAWALVASALGALTRSRSLVESGERSALAVTVSLGLASFALASLFLGDRFDVEYVASYSSRAMPALFKLTAFWGGHAGSLLLWVLVLSGFSALVILQNRRQNRVLMPYVVATLSGVTIFFLWLLHFTSNPFDLLGFMPADGKGLNPQLQTPLMAIHPPCLYLGYVGVSVPYAFAMAALMSGRVGDVWIRTTRRWTIFAWLFLGVGLLLGGYWAYIELGWGGYWAWDPVENAALMPWLTATAFLHSVMIQEKKRMLKIWNMSLIILTFCLSIFGTFLTRSGVISSVHAFAKSGVGPVLSVFLGVVVAFSVTILTWRLPHLQSEGRLDSFVSRESSFLFNNLLLVGITFAVFWGTIFPVVSEAVRGVKITVGPPFFNTVNFPLSMALLALTGVCPLIAWRRASARKLARIFLVPAGIGTAVLLLLLILGMREISALVAFSLCAFVFATVAYEFLRGAAARRRSTGEPYPAALASLVNRNRRRYGGYIVHVGVLLIFVGVVGSSFFRQESTFTLRRGESTGAGRYTLRFDDTLSSSDAHLDQFTTVLAVLEQGRPLGTIRPARNFYKTFNQPSTEVDIYSTLREDLYLILIEFDPQSGRATFKYYINPLINWIWIGWMVVFVGAHVAVWPDRRERALLARARLIEERGLA
jgi:cytochrome c-type biogenesis protein CcmF